MKKEESCNERRREQRKEEQKSKKNKIENESENRNYAQAKRIKRKEIIFRTIRIYELLQYPPVGLFSVR